MEKNILQSLFFSSLKKWFMKKSSLKFSVKNTNGVSQECWKSLFNSYKLVFMKIFFMISLNDIFISGGYRELMIEKKKYFVEKACFHWKLLPLKKFDWFGMIHQWVYTRMMINLEKNSEEKTYSKIFSKNEFSITLLSVGV